MLGAKARNKAVEEVHFESYRPASPSRGQWLCLLAVAELIDAFPQMHTPSHF